LSLFESEKTEELVLIGLIDGLFYNNLYK